MGDPKANNEASVRWLVQSLARGAIDTLNRNRLATVLAAATAAALIVLTVDSRSDGLNQYREIILPRLERLEAGFLESLQTAQLTSGDLRAYYFENAHRQLLDILRVASLVRPEGYVARAKHREFIRYYESIDAKFNQIGAEVSLNPNMDYVRRLKEEMEKVKPLRNSWARWAMVEVSR